jgi:hypothetical protein
MSRKWYYFFGINLGRIFGDNMKKVELSMKGGLATARLAFISW